MATTSNNLPLPTLRSPYIRTPSTDDLSFDATSDTTEYPSSIQTLIRPETRPNPEYQNVSRRTIFLRLFSLWIATVLLTASVVGVVYAYQAKGVLTPAQKSTYSLLVTVFILALGLSFFAAFKELARHMRVTISRLFGANGEEEELIRCFDNLLEATRLIFVTSKWRLRAFCVFWLAINLAAQMLAALISLEMTLEDGHNYNGTYIKAGQASVSKVDCVYQGKNCAPDPVTIHARAHLYGEMALGTEIGDYDDIPGLLRLKKDVSIWRRHDRLEYAHRFNEYNENDAQQAYPHLTERIITTSSSGCIKYDVEEVPMPDSNSRRVTYRNQSFKGTIDILGSSLGKEGTTYIYRGYKVPAHAGAPDVVCGDRCMYVWVYKNPGKKEGPTMYQCPIAVSEVSNTKLPQHNLPNPVARVAAVSIALEGRRAGDMKNPDYHQYQFHAYGTPWEIHHHNRTEIAGKVGLFAMGSLSSMIKKNPKISLAGSVPHLGSRLTVDSPAFAAILICLVTTHLTVFTLTYMLARPRA